MSNLEKIFAPYTKFLLLTEPYEMTYWKNKLNSPFHRFKVAVKVFLMRMHISPRWLEKL